MTTYAGNRTVIDIDAHILEPVGWPKSYASASVRDEIPELGVGDPGFAHFLEEAARDHELRASDPAPFGRSTGP